jgi:hypothetical protein
MHHHVGVLILRRLGAVALGIGIGRDMEDVGLDHALDMAGDVLGELRVDLVEDIASVIQRPHLAHGLIAHARDDAANILHDRVDGLPFVMPVLLHFGQAVEDGMAVAVLLIGERRGMLIVMLHVIHACPYVDDRLHRRMGCDVLHPLAVDPHFPPVAQALTILLTRPDHRSHTGF